MCTTHILMGKPRPPCLFEKSLIQTEDIRKQIPQMIRVAFAVASFRFPSNHTVCHISRSLHASYEATSTGATILQFAY